MSEPTSECVIHPLLQQRRSPYGFEVDRCPSSTDLAALFEAARWAMSSYNAQPWRYIVGVRNRSDGPWRQVLDCLLPANQAWAQRAPVLALGLTQRDFEYNGKPNRCSEHDLGAASAYLTLEAEARGLRVHQMAGIDPERVQSEFRLGTGLKPVTALAIGYEGNPEGLDASYIERDRAPRERIPVESLIVAGGW